MFFLTDVYYSADLDRIVNHDLNTIVTPLDVGKFAHYLRVSEYDQTESEFLIDGFTNGFDIGYKGPEVRHSRSHNIPFTVGDKFDMWDKIMKEVKAKRFVGPYEEIPYENFIQSPIGLVPKNGNKTRLIFHLSYCFGEGAENQSVNAGTPREEYTVRYYDLDSVILSCLEMSKQALLINKTHTICVGKTDLFSAFHVLPLKIKCFCWLILMAQDPKDGKWKIFVDKCLPFGASISCSHYQRFSNALRHITQFKPGQKKAITNYLDDFLFVAIDRWICNQLMQQFIDLCTELKIPIAHDKTEWASTLVIFLGILLDGERLLLMVPLEKQSKALKLLQNLENQKKITIKELQVLSGYLNFLSKVIQPGRTFTRRIYAKFSLLQFMKSGKALKPHHHVRIDDELRFDCGVWKVFLENFTSTAVCRPMIDLEAKGKTSQELMFYSDTSTNSKLGFGVVFANKFWLLVSMNPVT